jgi:hypothetical protein
VRLRPVGDKAQFLPPPSTNTSLVRQKFVMIRAIPGSRENVAQASAAFGIGKQLEHDPEKRKPVFGKDHAQT